MITHPETPRDARVRAALEGLAECAASGDAGGWARHLSDLLATPRDAAYGVATDYLATPPSQTFNMHFHGAVNGSSVVVGATGTTLNLRAAVGESMLTLAAKATELLAAWDEFGDDREEVEADIELLKSEAPNPVTSVGHIKSALRRVQRWAATAALTGASAALSDEVRQLAGHVLQQL
jgi:hypothetical protein